MMLQQYGHVMRREEGHLGKRVMVMDHEVDGQDQA